MTFYQELQLSSVGSKQLIKNTTDPKEKRRHILIYNFKAGFDLPDTCSPSDHIISELLLTCLLLTLYQTI